jgi:Peptidase M50B-like
MNRVVGGWPVRPVVWFAAGSIVTTIVHELSHACAAFALGVRSTLFNYSANLDLTPVQAASNLPALIRVAGPLVSLAVGLVSWLAFRRERDSAVALPLLYMSVFGMGTFLGNSMSMSFVGDFSAAAIALELPMTVRLAISVAGALCLAAVHFWAGRELVQWVPAHVGRAAGILGIIGMPVVLGTAAVILVNQPMPGSSVNARMAEAGFWFFAVCGALVAVRDPQRQRPALAPRWGDGVMVLLAVLLVRLMVRGVPFVP